MKSSTPTKTRTAAEIQARIDDVNYLMACPAIPLDRPWIDRNTCTDPACPCKRRQR
jgi:hypothetical protein